jgi:hypothetical protein
VRDCGARVLGPHPPSPPWLVGGRRHILRPGRGGQPVCTPRPALPRRVLGRGRAAHMSNLGARQTEVNFAAASVTSEFPIATNSELTKECY